MEKKRVDEALKFLDSQEIEAQRKLDENVGAFHVNFRIGLLRINAVKEAIQKLVIEQEAPGRTK